MNQRVIKNILIGIYLFLEGYIYLICYNIISHVLGIPDSSIPFWMALITLLCSFFLSFVVQTINFSLNVRGVMGLFSGVISIFALASIHHELNPFQVVAFFNESWAYTVSYIVSLIFLTILWWRGGLLARDEITLEGVRNVFQVGVLLITIGILISTFTVWTVSSAIYILLFFTVGLIGLSLARFAGQPSNYQVSLKAWLIPICLSVAIVISVGMIMGGLGISGLDQSLQILLQVFGDIAEWILKPLLYVLGFIASALIIFGTWLSDLFGGGNLDGLEFALEHTQNLYEHLEEPQEDKPNHFLLSWLKIATLGSLGIALGWCLFKVFRFKKSWSNQSQSEIIRESFLTKKMISNDIKEMLHHVLNKSIPLLNKAKPYTRDPKNAREIYHQFLVLTQDLGYPRNSWQSPKEHQASVINILPSEPVGQIISKFQDFYYGNNPDLIADIDHPIQAWHSVLNHVDTRESKSREVK